MRVPYNFVLVVVALGVLALRPGIVGAQPPDPASEKLARMQKLLAETHIETRHFHEKLPLSQFLTTLEKLLPKGTKVVLDLPGPDQAKIEATHVQLPRAPKRLGLLPALQHVLGQLKKAHGTEAEIGIAPDRVLITSPQRAAYTVTHDAREINPQLDWRLHTFSERPVDLKSTRGPALLKLVVALFEPKSGETLRLLNGTKVTVHATPARQQELSEVLHGLRRLSDVAVVMDAELYEVDRAFFKQHLAPLLAEGKEGPERPVAPVTHDGPPLKKLRQQKLLVQGDDLKIQPGKPTSFLSLQEVFPLKVSAPPKDPLPRFAALPTTAVTGVAFLTRVEVAADRRYIRLEITQQVEQPGATRAVRFGDKEVGFEEVESPEVKTTTLTTTVSIPDGVPIIMPVAYRPPGAQGKDRVWVLLATPRIYIEEEEALIRQGLLPPIPKVGR